MGGLADPLKAGEFKEWRRSVGLSQAEAAKVFGVSLRSIENWEQGVSSPRPVYGIRKQMLEMRGRR
jgi:DNA-binding transcriptional regulator YiaG